MRKKHIFLIAKTGILVVSFHVGAKLRQLQGWPPSAATACSSGPWPAQGGRTKHHRSGRRPRRCRCFRKGGLRGSSGGNSRVGQVHDPRREVTSDQQRSSCRTRRCPRTRTEPCSTHWQQLACRSGPWSAHGGRANPQRSASWPGWCSRCLSGLRASHWQQLRVVQVPGQCRKSN